MEHKNLNCFDLAPSVLTIDTKILRDNYKCIASNTKAQMSCVVKSNAYGLGASESCKIFYEEGCRHFYVAHLYEAVLLREKLPNDAFIYVLHGILAKEEKYFEQYNLIPVINNKSQFDIWLNYSKQSNKVLEYVLHIDTGINRIGVKVEDFVNHKTDTSTNQITSSIEQLTLTQVLDSKDNIVPKIIITHLSCGAYSDNPENSTQLEKFLSLQKKVKPLFKNTLFSIANGPGFLLGPEYHLDMLRVGSLLYGLILKDKPLFSAHKMHDKILIPITYKTKIINISNIKKGEFVGYSKTYEAKKDIIVATMPVGYGEKLMRQLSNTNYNIKIGNHYAPVIGTISMNLATIDVTEIPKNLLFIGQEVIVANDELIKKTSFLYHEMLTNFQFWPYKLYI